MVIVEPYEVVIEVVVPVSNVRWIVFALHTAESK